MSNATSSDVLPWQTAVWQQLQLMRAQQVLPHALLFTGQPGLGKRLLAEQFSRSVLCQHTKQDGTICETCHACHLMQAQSHPDFRIITPEKMGQAIKIDQIRQVADFVQMTSHQAGYRIILIQPADAMNHYAANALLKTLEEPSPRTLLILISDQCTALPVTIVSRCQQVKFTLPKTEQALQWLCAKNPAEDWSNILTAVQGAPLLAIEWQSQGLWARYQEFMRNMQALTQQQAEPLQLALQWKDTNMLWLCDMFFQWILCLLRSKQIVRIPKCTAPVSSTQLFEFADYLQSLRRDILEPFHLNQQIVLESLFIKWSQYVSG